MDGKRIYGVEVSNRFEGLLDDDKNNNQVTADQEEVTPDQEEVTPDQVEATGNRHDVKSNLKQVLAEPKEVKPEPEPEVTVVENAVKKKSVSFGPVTYFTADSPVNNGDSPSSDREIMSIIKRGGPSGFREITMASPEEGGARSSCNGRNGSEQKDLSASVMDKMDRSEMMEEEGWQTVCHRRQRCRAEQSGLQAEAASASPQSVSNRQAQTVEVEADSCEARQCEGLQSPPCMDDYDEFPSL